MIQASPSSPNEKNRYSLEHWQERFVLGILRVAAVFGLVSMVAVFNPTTTNLLRILYIAVYTVLLVMALAPIPYAWRAGFVIAVGFILGLSELSAGGLVGAARLYLMATVILSNLLFSYRTSIITLVASTLAYLIAGWAIVTGLYHPTLSIAIQGAPFDWVVSGATYIFIAATLNLAIQMLKTEFQTSYQHSRDMLAELEVNRLNLEERVAERTASLEKRTAELTAASDMARRIAATKEIESMFSLVVNSVTENFEAYHAAIYLLDDKAELGFLQAASSDIGKRLLASGFQVNIAESDGLIQRCVLQRRVQSAPDITPEDAVHKQAEFPNTRSRVVIPISSRERMLGVLDVHSGRAFAFQTAELEALQIAADQLGLTVDNTKLLSDMQALIEQMQSAGDVRTYLAWNELSKRRKPVYQYTPLGIQAIAAAPEPREEDPSHLMAPIVLRGQIIGKIHMRRKGTSNAWLSQERLLVHEVAAQVALAMENARLLEEAQTRASRERSLTEIATRIGAAFDVDAILRTTAQEIGKALGDAEVTIQLENTGSRERQSA